MKQFEATKPQQRYSSAPIQPRTPNERQPDVRERASDDDDVDGVVRGRRRASDWRKEA